ncbi:MAG: hypothetical protein IT209_10010 [Armatimonadetes bacterium]|nr:hypothetical protein [Armatimonadota bacterium]
MPLLSRWFVRTSLIYLCLGFLIGGALLWSRAIGHTGVIWRLLPVHVAWLLFGWMMQLAMGVAYWIMPKSAAPETAERPLTELAWASYASLNLSLLVLALSAAEGHFFGALRPASGALLGLSVLFYAAHLWPRIRAVTQAQGASR